MDDHALQRLQSTCGSVLDAAGLLTGNTIEPRYSHDGIGGEGRPLAVLRPRSPEKVALVMIHLHSLRQPVVAQGGMTGWVGGCVLQHVYWAAAHDRRARYRSRYVRRRAAHAWHQDLRQRACAQHHRATRRLDLWRAWHRFAEEKVPRLLLLPAELTLMRTLKLSLDPQQLLNHGRIFDLAPLHP